MSDHEEDTNESYESSSKTKNHKMRRLSIEIEVTELVKSGKLQTKSDDLKRQERFYNDYDKELDLIDVKKAKSEDDLASYEQLKSNMDMYFNDELTIDMNLEQHRYLTAFLKKHVSLITPMTEHKNILSFRVKKLRRKSINKSNCSRIKQLR